MQILSSTPELLKHDSARWPRNLRSNKYTWEFQCMPKFDSLCLEPILTSDSRNKYVDENIYLW